MNNEKLFSKVLDVQEQHTTFLDATEKNYGYFLFGKNVNIVKKNTLPMVDIMSAVAGFVPDADNPLHNIVSSFMDEISVSEFKTIVKPSISGKEPYESYSDQLETMLQKVHKKSKRRRYLKSLVFELLVHGYFGIYCDGSRYYFMSAYDFFPADKSILDGDDQPFLVRKTQATGAMLQTFGVNPKNEQASRDSNNDYKGVEPLELYTLYDVWSKPLDKNILYTEAGSVVYEQALPYPKKYPIAVANVSEVMNSFYTLPIISQLIEKLKDYQKASSSVKDSSSNIAKPLLVYDTEAGIDIDAVTQAMKEGYKHVVVGKNSQGDIGFKAPGQIPVYAQQLPDKTEEAMMKSLGLNQAFLGHSGISQRERGAITRLIKTSFRKLLSVSGTIEDAFTEIDDYLIDYYANHSITCGKRLGMNIEEIFSGPVKYEPTERFAAYSSDDTFENKNFVVNKWRNKLIPTVDALEELGDTKARKTVRRMREEVKENQEFGIELQKKAQASAGTSLIEKVSNQLRGALQYQFYLTPIANEKILVKVHITETERVAFLLSNLTQKVLIDTYMEDKPASLEQQDPAVDKQPEAPIELAPEEGAPKTRDDNRGRPQEVPNASKENEREVNKAQVPEQEPIAQPAQPAKTEEVVGAESEGPDVFDEADIQKYLEVSKPIYSIDAFRHLDGIYLKEPQAKQIHTGSKLAILLAKDSKENLDKRMLLTGDKVYGVIILRKMVADFDFELTSKYHRVSAAQRKKWWGDKTLYLYVFEYHPFKYPAEYNKKPGQLTFMSEVDFKDSAKNVDGPVKDNNDIGEGSNNEA